MVTIQEYRYVVNRDLDTGAESPKTEVFCLAADTKPTTVPNGTIATETDTGDKYIFDGDGGTWTQITI